MIISKTKEPIEKFELLLEDAHNLITSEANKNPKNFLNKDSSDFEKIVLEALKEKAKGTPFNEKIELISGHSFPDIIVKDFYGVEVKTVRKNQWKSAGNRYSVVSPSLRDEFTAGGKQNIKINNKVYKSRPKIFKTLQEYKEGIFERIKTISKDDLKYYWDKNLSDKKSILKQWAELCINNCEPENRNLIRDLIS